MPAVKIPLADGPMVSEKEKAEIRQFFHNRLRKRFSQPELLTPVEIGKLILKRDFVYEQNAWAGLRSFRINIIAKYLLKDDAHNRRYPKRKKRRS